MATAGPSTQIPRKSIGLETYSPVSNLEAYNVMSCIGKGSFGVIHKVARKSDGHIFALKELDYSKMIPKDRKQMLQEVSILDSLKHEHVVQLVDKILDKTEQKIFIVMEYCGGGDLGSIISLSRRSGKPIPESSIWSYFIQLVLALHHCHWPEERTAKLEDGLSEDRVPGIRRSGTGQVLHRDLKPENIFLDETQEMVKLGDFGLSKNLGANKFTTTYVGTPLYMPPEILTEHKYDTKSDIWSLGCLIFELCTLSSPFAQAQSQSELLSLVNSGRIPPLPAYLSRELKDAIKSMLQLNPAKRPSTGELLAMGEMKFHKRMHSLTLRANALIRQKQRLAMLEKSILTREKTIFEREKAVAQAERELESDRGKAREQYEKFAREKAAWEKERERERRSFGSGEVGQGRVGWPSGEEGEGAGVVMESRLPRRTSTAAQRPVLGDRGLTANSSSRTSLSSWNDTPTKAFPPLKEHLREMMTADSPRAGEATPGRTLHKTRSLTNIGYHKENYSPGAEPMDLSTPYKVQQTDQRASVASPADFARRFRAKQGRQTSSGSSSEELDVTMETPAKGLPRGRKASLIPTAGTRPPFNHANTTSGIGSLRDGEGSSGTSSSIYPTLPSLIPAPTYTYKELATPAKWSPDDPNAPSPFLKRMPVASASSDAVVSLSSLAIHEQPAARGAFAKRPSMVPSGSRDLRRLATMANAKTGMASRDSGETISEENGMMASPIRSRAALAQMDAMRAMHG